MPAVVIDACVILNLYASGRFVPILSALPHDWYIPTAVERESHQYRQPAPDDPAKLIILPIDLNPAFDAQILTRCDCENDDETSLYVELAGRIGDDGESMGLAIAKCRGWWVLTDDKKARRIATELGVPVVSTPEVIKQWTTIATTSATDLSQVIEAIERFANYRPARTATDYEWWVKSRDHPKPKS